MPVNISREMGKQIVTLPNWNSVVPQLMKVSSLVPRAVPDCQQYHGVQREAECSWEIKLPPCGGSLCWLSHCLCMNWWARCDLGEAGLQAALSPVPGQQALGICNKGPWRRLRRETEMVLLPVQCEIIAWMHARKSSPRSSFGDMTEGLLHFCQR